MNKRDRTFLNEMVQFMHMNHIAAMHMLWTILQNGTGGLDAVALACRSAMGSTESEDALRQMVQANHDAARIERVVVAKMYAEMIAAYEDLGALGFAIKHRAKGGVFARYLKSSPAEDATFFDDVLKLDIENNPEITLDQILNLPPLSGLASRLSATVFDELKRDYEEYPKHLSLIAHQYRDQSNALSQVLSPSSPPDPTWNDDLNILLEVTTPGSPSPNGGTLVRAFNKIKHRFMITDNLLEYADATLPDAVEYGRFPLDPSFVDRFRTNTISAAGSMAELAALMVVLDQNGVAL